MIFIDIASNHAISHNMSDKKEQLIVEDIDHTVCPICLEAVTDVGLANVCRHLFCANCLIQWTAQHNFCPLCRQVIEVVVAVTHRRHQNFDLIVVETDETRERKNLMAQRDSLRQRLIRERDLRIKQIDEFNQRLEEIASGLQQLNLIRHQNNSTVQEMIGKDDKEFKVMKELNHENVVRIYESFEINGKFYCKFQLIWH